MLLKRTLVAVGFIPVLISLILWSKAAFFILVCLIIGVSLFEFYQRMRKEGENIFLTEGILLGLLIPVGVYLRGEGVLPILLVFIILFLCLRQSIHLKIRQAFVNVSLTLGGVLYISFLFSYIISLRDISSLGARLVVTIFFATWMGDAGAYLIGEKWGRHKLFPRVSPHKSWEGFIGALLVSCVAMFISRMWLFLPLVHTLILGVLIGVMGQMGDFFESMLKREVGIKDFGKILPGHGGVLDRFDSLLFTVPVFYYYVKFMYGM